MPTILIKNGLIYDGSGCEPLKADILVRGERIASIGNFGKRRADKTIDAQGAIVAPGFIDINSECDHSFGIFLEPYQENHIKQGVTTVIGGNRGISLAPVSRAALDFMRNWLGSFPVNVNWHSVKDFLRVLQKRGLGVNFGTVVGSATIRQSVVGDRNRDLTDNEIELCKNILSRSLDDGAFGFSDSGG
ncbi:MAG: aminoacylase, partial [Patescibacteria group bacterium]